MNLRDELWGPIFEPLRDPAVFARATGDPVLGTVVWPNGADFSPEFLHYGDEEPHPSDESAIAEAKDDRAAIRQR